MAVSAERLLEELQIFGLDCEEALSEKRESRAPGRVALGCRRGPPPQTGVAVGFGEVGLGLSPAGMGVHPRHLQLWAVEWVRPPGTAPCSPG